MILLLVLAIVAVFFYGDSSALALRPHAFEPVTLLTSLFAHKNAEHLALNVVSLGAAGAVFERRHGSWALLAFCAGTGVLSNLAEMWGAPDYNGAILGASGVACALMGALASTNWASAGLSCLLLSYFSWSAYSITDPLVSHWAHLTGYVCGLGWAILSTWKQARSAS